MDYYDSYSVSSIFAGAENCEYKDLGLDEILKGMRTLDKLTLRVGVVGPAAQQMASSGNLTLGELATILEYGSRGMNIPAYHFIGSSIDPQMVKKEGKAVMEVVTSFGNVEAALDKMGKNLADKIRGRIYSNAFGHNNPETIRKKGFDHPLMDSSLLADSITFQIVRGNGDSVDGGASSNDYQAFSISGGE